MALTVREQVIDAAADLVAGIDGYRQFERMPARGYDVISEYPGLVFEEGESQVLTLESGFYTVRQAFSVTIFIKARSGDDPECRIGPLLSSGYGDVRAAVAGWQTDAVLGSTCRHVEWVGTSDPLVETEDGTAPIASIVCDFVLMYDEAENDPYSVA